MDRDTLIVKQATRHLTAQDLAVANIGFRFHEDLEEGYGAYYDGMEACITNAQSWLMSKLTHDQPMPQIESKYMFDGKEYNKERFRRFEAPDGSLDQDVNSDAYQEWGDKERNYEGLNIDDDCAVAELLTSVAYAYMLWADGYDWEMTLDRSPKWGVMFGMLELTHEQAAKRYDELSDLINSVLKGKHDRNSTIWC